MKITTNVKSEVKIKFDTQEKNMAKMGAEMTSGVTVSQAVTSASVKNLEDNARNEFDTIKNTLNNQTGRLGQMEIESQSVASRIAMIESSINTLQAHTINEVNSLKAQLTTIPNIAGAGQREDYSKLKPITEYKAIAGQSGER